MVTKYVYYIKSQNRLVITNKTIDNNDYVKYTTSFADDDYIAKRICEAFCIGYIKGNLSDIKVLNDFDEFL